MDFNWNLYKVGNICETVSVTHKFSKEKLIFLNTGDIEKGKVLHRNYTDIKSMPGQAKKSIQENDILFSEIRPANGRWTFVNFEADDYIVSTKLMVIRAKEQVLPKFLYNYLTSHETTKWLQHLAESRSGTFPQITFTQVADLDINLPPKEEQQQIIEYIEAIDEKIKTNEEIAFTAEEIVHTIFKEWFINFNYPGDDGQRHHSILGEIPPGWEAGKLSTAIELNPKYSLKKGQQATYVEMKDLSETHCSIKNHIQREFMGGSKFQNGDTLFARITPCLENGKTGLVNFLENHETGWGSTEFIVLRGKPNINRYYVYCLSRFQRFRKFAIQSMVGSSGRQRVVESILADYNLILPTTEVLNQFEEVAIPLFEQINISVQENKILFSIRDALLPNLMKGEINLINE